MDMITRKDAAKAGLTLYFVGRTCKRGHVAPHTVAGRSCTVCKKDNDNRTARERLKKPERIALNRARVKKWTAENPEKYAAYQKQWRAKNADKMSKTTREWRQKNPVRQLRNRESWIARNPEKAAASRLARSQRRRAALAQAPGNCTPQEIAALLKKQKGKCVACLKKEKRLHLDHIVPLSKGGPNNISNFQFLCRHCNSTKHAKDPFVWAQQCGRLL